MKPISTDLENIFQPVPLREDEYLDEESKLIYTEQNTVACSYGIPPTARTNLPQRKALHVVAAGLFAE